MNTIETPITKEKVAALVADAFQDSEYFLPKIALQDQLGLDVEVISLKRDPIEIYSNFSRIGLLDVSKTIQEADPAGLHRGPDSRRRKKPGASR